MKFSTIFIILSILSFNASSQYKKEAIDSIINSISKHVNQISKKHKIGIYKDTVFFFSKTTHKLVCIKTSNSIYDSIKVFHYFFFNDKLIRVDCSCQKRNQKSRGYFEFYFSENKVIEKKVVNNIFIEDTGLLMKNADNLFMKSLSIQSD